MSYTEIIFPHLLIPAQSYILPLKALSLDLATI